MSPLMRVVPIFHLLILTLILEQQFIGTAADNSAISEGKLKEITKIRADLNETLDGGDEHVGKQAVVVQPTWLTEKGQQPESKTPNKVEVTQKAIDEVNALREEINKSKPTQKEIIEELVKEFETLEAGRDALEKIVGTASDNNVDEAFVGGSMGDDSEAKDKPNLIEAIANDVPEFDIRKLHRLEISKRRMRETLILKSIEEDFTFNLGDGVDQWEHIVHNGSEYFIGLRERNLLVVHKESATYEEGTVVEVGEPITYLLTYSFWNDQQAQTEGVTLIATGDRVFWYRVSNVTRNVELYWRWVVGNTITGLTYFTVEGRDYLIVSTNQSTYTGFYMLNIYQFELSSREFWIAQRMQLKFPCVGTTLLDTGRDLILAVPQNNSAAIYTFNPRTDDTDYIRFKLKQHIESEDCESVTGFKMGGRSYIAISGRRPQILLYQQGELVPKTILAQNFGVVELFFPVPVRTYRDDLLLLVQHRVEFGTHNLIVLETLIWDGEAFETSIPVPCKLGEHIVYGVSCMLDVHNDAGLKGAAYFRRNDEVSIIVPRDNAESGLFRLHTQLLAKNSEYLDLQEIFAFLKEWVQEEDDLIALAHDFLGMSAENGLRQVQPDLTELTELETPVLLLDDGEVGEIYVNDYRWTAEDSQLDLKQVLLTIEELDAEINAARRRRDAFDDELNFNYLEFDSLDVDELIVQKLNGKEFYVQNGILDFNGLLNVRELEVAERLDADGVISEVSEGDGNINDDSETFIFDGDIELEYINGKRWIDIEDNIVFTNQAVNFTELKVEGEVILENEFSLNVLNSRNFPDDYLWTSGPEASIVRAEKTFINTLSVNALETESLLNGLNASTAITLNHAQEWHGLVTFADLTVQRSLELNGTMRGRDNETLPHNPTLKDAKDVEAICNFRELEIIGPLLVKDSLDEEQLGPLLSDVVQRSADPHDVITVRAKKYFADVQMPIDFEVLDGKVNDIPVEKFVPAHTNQSLDLAELKASVYFSNLTTSGLFDGVDIEELMKNAIKLDAPQKALKTHLHFMQGLQGNSIHVTSSLNGLAIEEAYQTIYEDINITRAKFEQLSAKEANINGSIGGENATWNGEKKHSPNHSLIGDIHVDELELESGIEVDKVQGLNISSIWKYLEEIDDLLEMVLDGKILVDHVIVTGNVHVYKLNQLLFDEDLQLTIIWLNRPNFLSTFLTFSEPLNVHGKLQIDGHLNDRNLAKFIEDIVFREPTNRTVEVLSTKSFTQTVHVLGDTHVYALNGVHFNNIATKKSIPNFRGSVQLNGSLVVGELELTGALNGYSMSAFTSAVRYNRSLDTFIVQGLVNFYQPHMFLQDLTILGDLNDMPNLAHFFNELTFKDNSCILRGHNTFTGRVRIDKGAYILNLNDFNLLELLQNIVYANEPLPVVIRSPIIFKDVVRAHNMFVSDSLAASKLNGFVLEEWFNDTLRLDRPQEIHNNLFFAPRSLDGNSFFVSYLNNIDLSEIVTLHTSQNLTGNITFSQVHLDGEIRVCGVVNDVDLQKEYANTLMTHGDQHVITPLTLRSALVRGNITINAPINNNKDLRNVATLQGDQHFQSPLFFENITTEELQTKYPVSGINLDAWLEATLHTHGKPEQVIVGNWSARTLTVKSGPTLPSYVTDMRPSNLPFGGLMRSVRAESDFQDLCEKLKIAVKYQQKRGYHLKYLERSFELTMKDVKAADDFTNATILTAFALEKGELSYVLINTENLTYIMMWNASSGMYSKVQSFEAGSIDQVLTVDGSPTKAHSLYFVTNKVRKDDALRYWSLENSNLTLLKTFEKSTADLMLSPLKPNKLYGVYNDIVYGYDLSIQSYTATWLLPNFIDNDQYRFVPQQLASSLMFTNGAMIVTFNDANDVDGFATNEENFMRDKRTSAPRYSLPLSYQRVMSPQPHKLSQTVLQPNASAHTHHYRLADFRVVIGHILDDLNYRLRLEVNITQLSIPETDLHDEHLLRDSIAIMEELQRQRIYPNTSFESIEFDDHNLFANPALILAARTVQILWPCIVDMEEIHGYLQSSDNEGEHTVVNIMDHLGTTVRDVLALANGKDLSSESTAYESSLTAAHAHELAAIVGRIHNLQDQLQSTMRDLKRQEFEQPLIPPPSPHRHEDMEMSASELNPTTAESQTEVPPVVEFSELTRAETTWLKFPNKNFPTLGEGEMVSILVRTQKTPFELLAVVEYVPPPPQKEGVNGTQQHEIVLYEDVLTSKRFQTISAHKPHSLISFQIGIETLFAYIEDCCAIRVLLYRGVEGFVDFASFETSIHVLKIFSVMLPDSDGLVQQPHLVVAHANSLVFYRFVALGTLLRMPESFLCG